VELYRWLGMSAQHGRSALELLKRQGYVVYTPVRQGKGRPVSSHHISPGFRFSLEELKVPTPIHQAEIESLCRQAFAVRQARKYKAQNLMSGEERARMLTPATYWLLCVLLAHAESPGVVRGLSYGRLQSITGMTKERLKSQLSKLKRLGLIVRHEPGELRSQGEVRMCSVYVLDLAHALLWGERSMVRKTLFITPELGSVSCLSGFYEASVVACKIVESLEGRPYGQRAMALEESLETCLSILPPREYLEPAVKDLLRINRLGISRVLKAHVQSFVMTLLSNHWGDLERKDGPFPIDAVMEAISRDCVSLIDHPGVQSETRPYNPLLLLVYAWAHCIAVDIQNNLKLQPMDDQDLAGATFLIKEILKGGRAHWEVNLYHRSANQEGDDGHVAYVLQSINLQRLKGLAV